MIRYALIAAGIMSLIFGGMFVFFVDFGIQSFQLGSGDITSRLLGRVLGVSQLAFALMNFTAARGPVSPALKSLVAGNFFLHLFGPVVDLMETFPRTGTYWATAFLDAVFIIWFGYCLLNWKRLTSSNAGA
jgi:hypothetical protein